MSDEPQLSNTDDTKSHEPDDGEPSPEWQAESRAAYEANVSQGKPPFEGVWIRTRGELMWVMGERGWSGESFTHTPADFRGAYLYKANLSAAELDSANLSGAELSSANLAGANLFKANLSGASLTEANLSRATLNHANLSGVPLYEGRLSDALLDYANLSAATLFTANLSRV